VKEDLPKLLDERAAAERLGVKASSLRTARIRGLVAHVRLGTRVFYTVEQLAEYIETQSVRPC